MIPAFLTTLLFSISAATGRRTARVLGGIEANFWRLIVATIFLAVVAHGFGVGISGEAFPIFFLSGCVGFGIGDLALYQALPRIGSRLTVMLVLCLSAPFAAALEWLWLGTALTPGEIVAAVTILAGVGLALAPGVNADEGNRQFGPGILFGLVASACQGLGAVLSRKGFGVAAQAGDTIDGLSAAYQRILGGVLVALLSLLLIKRGALLRALRNYWSGRVVVTDERRNLWRGVWPWVVVNGMSGSALGVSCFQWALQTTPTGIVLPIVATTPIVIIPFSRYLEGERPSARSLLGGAVAVTGAVALAIVKR